MKGVDKLIHARLVDAAETLANGRTIPLELPELCSQFGVKIERAPIGTAKALLVDARKNPRIFLPVGGSSAFSCWERFLIAHELGHLVLHIQNVPRPKGTSEYWRVEHLCDAFARRLLVPERRFGNQGKAAAHTAMQRLGLARYLEKAAQVTWQAAAMRVTDWHPDCTFLQLQRDSDGGMRVSFSSSRKEMGRKLAAHTPLFTFVVSHPSEDHMPVANDLLEAFPSLVGAHSCVAVRGNGFVRVAAVFRPESGTSSLDPSSAA